MTPTRMYNKEKKNNQMDVKSVVHAVWCVDCAGAEFVVLPVSYAVLPAVVLTCKKLRMANSPSHDCIIIINTLFFESIFNIDVQTITQQRQYFIFSLINYPSFWMLMNTLFFITPRYPINLTPLNQIANDFLILLLNYS